MFSLGMVYFSLVCTRDIVFLVPLYLIFFCLTVVLILMALEYVNVLKGLLSIGLNWFWLITEFESEFVLSYGVWYGVDVVCCTFRLTI